MKKAFFTNRTRRKLPKYQEKRSNSDENLATSWFSTNPKDLPDGFTVGSMSVPYIPHLQEQKEESDSRQKKNKKSKGHKSARKTSDSPLKSTRISLQVRTELDTNRKEHVISPPVLCEKHAGWVMMGKLQRSRSVDGLDEIKERITAVQKPCIERSKTEAKVKPRSPIPLYHREISDSIEVRRRNKELYQHNSRQNYNNIETGPKNQDGSPSSYRQLSRTDPQRILHEPKSVEHLMEALNSPEVNVNLVDDVTGDAPIHSIIKRKKKDRIDLLLALLVNSEVDINLQNKRNMTALHTAIEVGCEMCIRASIVFGADINKQGCNQFTPLDLVINNGNLSSIETILLNLGAKSSTQKLAENRKKVPRLYSFAENFKAPKRGERLSKNDNLSEFINRRGINRLYNELEINVKRRMSVSATMGGADDAYALVMQQRELALYNKTLPKLMSYGMTDYGLRGGSRILFLDGGGIKGLVQLEVLIKLEERTQCCIMELFDWIVGTSTGGVIALAMVYAKKTLRSLRQLYFLLKNQVFMKSRYGFGYSTEALEDILKDYLDPDIKMSDVTHPKVLVAAVNKATTNLELNFFNNCFGDDYVDYPVWKVARYTSAAPMFFTEFENYVDGGVICNNPTDYGLTAIQNYCRLQGYKLPIAVVVSIGTGIYPAEKIGLVDAQDALYFGKKWLKPTKLIKQTQNLISLLSNALVESELVAKNSRSRCKEQDIPFFRFSPSFDELIAAGETDNEKLFNMIIKTKLYLKQNEQELDKLTEIFHAVADSSKDLRNEVIIEEEPQVERDESTTGVRQEEPNTASNIAKKLNDRLSTQYDEPKEDDKSHSVINNAILSTPQTVAERKEEEEESISQLRDSTEEVNSCLLQPKESTASLNSIRNEMELKSEELTYVSMDDKLDCSGPLVSDTKISCPVTSGEIRDSASHWDPSENKNMVSDQSAQELYKPYRTDTQQVDESKNEYTQYNRETLV